MGDRERRKRQTRERLIEVALAMFNEHGYDATTVEMIADAAGVSARTFFRYFDAKDLVLAEPGSRLMAAVAQRLGDVAPKDRGIRTVLEAMAALLDDGESIRPIEIQAWNARSHSELREVVAALRHRWAGELATLLAEGDGREQPTFEEQAVCSASVAVMGAVFDEWFRLGGDADVLSLVRLAARAVCDDPADGARAVPSGA